MADGLDRDKYTGAGSGSSVHGIGAAATDSGSSGGGGGSGSADGGEWATMAVAAAAAAAAAQVNSSIHSQQHPDHTLGPPPPAPQDPRDYGSASDFLHAPNHASVPSAAAEVAAAAATAAAAGDSAVAAAAAAPPAKRARASGASSKAKGKQKENSVAADGGAGNAGKEQSDDQQVRKRRRVVVACDTCRRKKIRCQGLPNDTRTCDNCATYGYKCAFTFSANTEDSAADGSQANSAGGFGKGRTRGRYEILEAKVDSLLSIVKGLDPELAARWESGELGAGAGALTGVKKFTSEAKADPEASTSQQPMQGVDALVGAGASAQGGPPNDSHQVYASAAGPPPAPPTAYASMDQDPGSTSNLNAQYSAYIHDNVFGPSTTSLNQGDPPLDPSFAGAAPHAAPFQNGSADKSNAGPAQTPNQEEQRRKGKGGTGGDAHASAGLLLHLSQAAVHVQERDQRAKDGPEEDGNNGAAPAGSLPEGAPMSRVNSNNAVTGAVVSHLIPDIEDGRPRYYGKSSLLHFFNALNSRPPSPRADRAGDPGHAASVNSDGSHKRRGRKVDTPLYPLNSKEWVRVLRKKNLVAVGRDDDANDPTWFHRYQLPEPHTVAELLATYFATFHPLMPIVHRLSLERDLAFGRAEHDTAFRGLVFTLLAIASRLGSTESEKKRLAELGEEDRQKELDELEKRSDYYAAGSRMYHQVYAASLINVQVLLLTATFMHGSIGAGTAWTVLGVAVRVLLDIGLHNERAYVGFTPFEQQVRKRVFWGAYILDCIFAVNMGRPPALRLDECSVGLPVDLSEDALFAAEKGGPLDMTFPKGDQGCDANITSGFIHLAKLNVIAGDLLWSLYVPRNESPYFRRRVIDCRPPHPFPESELSRLLTALDQWVAEIPTHLTGPPSAVAPIFKLQAGIITCGMHDIRLYMIKPFLLQPSMKEKLFSQSMDHARKLLECVLQLFEDESLAGIVFIFQQAFWSAATFMITAWHHYKNASSFAADAHLIEGTLKILFSSDPRFFSSVMHRALRLLQRIAKRAMPEMEAARRERVAAYVKADDLMELSELAPELARSAVHSIHQQQLPLSFAGHVGHGTMTGSAGAGAPSRASGVDPSDGPASQVHGVATGVTQDQPWWRDTFRYDAAGSNGAHTSSFIPAPGFPIAAGMSAESSAWYYSSAEGAATAAAAGPSSGPGLGSDTAHAPGNISNHGFVPVSQGVPAASSLPAPTSAGPTSGNGSASFGPASSAPSESVSLPQQIGYYGAGGAGDGQGSGQGQAPFPYMQQFAGSSAPGQHQQGAPPGQHPHAQNMPPMAHANFQTTQTQIAFENSFSDAHGITGVGGPHPTLDDLAWTDYFASFLASLSDGPAPQSSITT